jgi:Fe-S cluster assembly scaffold protein SufB
MTKILAPLSSQIFAHDETRALVGDVRENIFVDAASEKKISCAYGVRGGVTQNILVEVGEGAVCDMKLLYRAHEKDTKLRVCASVLLHRDAEISFDLASFVEAAYVQSDVRIFVVFNEGAKATVRAFTRASEERSVVHEEVRGLVLGEMASLSFIPELSLLHDDIVATHATSMVKIDEKRVAYFLSRGVSREDAMRCFVDAFLYGDLF